MFCAHVVVKAATHTGELVGN